MWSCGLIQEVDAMPDMNDFYAFKNTSGGSGSSSDFNGLKFLLVVIIISIVFGILEALGN